MTSHSSASHDDAFHEIQLNGKQLFFLFMAATVVSVVIFLCGVLVGRGVRAERSADLEAANVPPSADPVPPNTTAGGAGADPTIILPPPAEEVSEVSPNTPVGGEEEKKPEPKAEKAPSAQVEKPSAAPPRPDAPAPKPASTAGTSSAAAAPPASSSSEPGARDWFVQVAAVLQKSEADPYVKRLAGKGYTARVVPPSDGTAFFRVRVGTFKTRAEAQLLADKLQKDTGIKPYVNR